MNKIYDCFTFNNELDLLELRLTELYKHVDKFVIVEANRTFQNTPKPFYFIEHMDRFAPWLDKIIHYPVTDMPVDSDAWGRERHQRDAIAQAVVDADADDIIFVSDLDEIIRPETADAIRADDRNSIWGMRMPLFYFKFNYMLTTTDSIYTTWAVACRKRLLNSAEDLRRNRFAMNSLPLQHNQDGIRMMEHAGWQFSYLGDTDFARSKIQSFSHVETNQSWVLDRLDIDSSIALGIGIVPSAVEKFVAVQINEYMPRTIRSNLDRYSKYLVPAATAHVTDFIKF